MKILNNDPIRMPRKHSLNKIEGIKNSYQMETSKMNLVQYLIALHESFHGDRVFWNLEIARANKACNEGYQFEPDVSHWFYSGELLKLEGGRLILNNGIKYIFITMSPMYVDDAAGRLNHIVLLDTFVETMNRCFAQWDRDNETSTMYDVVSKLTAILNRDTLLVNNGKKKKLRPDKVKPRYQYLQNNSVAIDWFPFHKKEFSINGKAEYSTEALIRILEFIQNSNAKLIAIGTDIIKCMKQLSKLKGSYYNNLKKQHINKPNGLEVFGYQGKVIYATPYGYKSDEYLCEVGNYILNNP